MKRTHLIALVVLLAGWLMPVTAPVVSVAAANPSAVVADSSSGGGATTNGWTDPVGG
jgi:ABC-type Fe2+-enterobactin transport system substrate-binding protein